MILPIAILAGGLATRLRPLTKTIPKALVEINGRPFVELQLELLREHGCRRVVLCVGHLGEMIRDRLGNGSRWGLDLVYVFDGARLLGTGGALRNALPELGSRFLIMYGDSYLPCDYRAIAAHFARCGKPGLITVFRNRNCWDRSNVAFRNGKVVAYDKKHQTAQMEYIDYGLGGLTADVLREQPPETVIDLEAIYRDLLNKGQLAALEINQRFYEVGSPAGVVELQEHLKRRERRQ